VHFLIVMMLSLVLSPRVYDTILPRPFVRTVDWADGRVAAPPPIKGTLRFDLFPYMVEPLDCLDDRETEIVTMQFGSRLGKTTAVQAWLLKSVATNPHDGIWAEPDQPSLARVLKRTWDMVDGTSEMDDSTLPPHQRSARELLFRTCLIHGAYSGSPSTAADFAAPLGAVLNELDKYSHRRRLDAAGEDSGEADFARLLIERTKGCPTAKIVQMSTPTVAGRSRIEAERLKGDRRRYYVPCPHCNHYQTLRTGDLKSSGGIRWKKTASGKSDPSLARETAWYECERCLKKILDEHRYELMNAGRWIKEGLRIDRRGRISGKPLVPFSRHASFGPLGTHYSLLPGITWGRIAEAFVSAVRDPLRKGLRNFVNAWEGECFDLAPVTVTAHELAARLAGETDRGVCPQDTRLVTFAADVGAAGGQLLFYWMVVAWRNDATGQVVDWGLAETWEKLVAEFVRDWPIAAKAEGGRMKDEKKPSDSAFSLQPSAFARAARGGVDSGGGRDDEGGGITSRVYELCASVKHLWPLKGSAAWHSPDWYTLGYKRAGRSAKEVQARRIAHAGDLLICNTLLSQSWRESLVSGGLQPGQAGFVALPADVCAESEAHADFLDELTSDVEIEGRWQRRGPNEYGDTLRYCRVLAELATLGGKRWGQLPPPRDPSAPPPAPKPQPPRFTTPDGRPFLVTER